MFASWNGAEYTELIIDHTVHKILLDRSRSTQDANVGTEQIEVKIPKGGCDYHIDIVLDHSSVEIFINERYTISARVFPDNVFGGIAVSEYPEQGAVEEFIVYGLAL